MKKALYLFAAMVMIGALSGCNVAPNLPGVTPYGTPGVYNSPAVVTGGPNKGATGLPYGNYSGGKKLPGGMNGYNLPGGAYGNNITGGTYSNGSVRPGMRGTYGSSSNTAGSKNVQNPTSRMNALMNERSYIFVNPGDKAAFPGAH